MQRHGFRGNAAVARLKEFGKMPIDNRQRTKHFEIPIPNHPDNIFPSLAEAFNHLDDKVFRLIESLEKRVATLEQELKRPGT